MVKSGKIQHGLRVMLACAILATAIGVFAAPSAWGLDLIFNRNLRVNATGMEGACAFGDITGDGLNDLIYARQSDEWGPVNAPGGADADPADFQITVRRNDGTDTWPTAATITYTAIAIPNQFYNSIGNGFNGNDEMTDVAIADMDGDTHNDIVACTLADGIVWFRNQSPYNGTSWSSANNVYRRTIDANTSYPNVRRVFPMDIDNDGDMDVAAAISESADGGNNPAGNPNAGSKLSVFWNNGTGTFTQKIIDIDPNLKFVISCRAAKLTGGDNLAELVITTLTNDVVRWYRNTGGTNGSMAFTGYLVTAAADFTDPWDTAAGDIDGDGDNDIVAVSEGGDRLRWFVNNGALDGTNFQTNYTIDTRAGGDPHYVQVIDMDNDGDRDVVATWFSTDEVIWYENLGGSPPTWSAHIIANASSPTPVDDGPENVQVSVAQKAGSDDPYVDVMVGNLNSQTVSFYNNITYNSGPSVSSVTQGGYFKLRVFFTKAMNTTECQTASNYTVSGPGKGTLAANPTSAAIFGGDFSQYELTWPASQEMLDGQSVTVTVSSNVHENDGVAPANVPIHDPKSGSVVASALLPTVTLVDVIDIHNIRITFSESMAAAGITDPNNYTMTGPGQGTMSAHPTSVALYSGNTYTLTWASGEMSDGGTVRITATGVTDLAGNPMGTPNYGEDLGIGSKPSADSVVYTSPNPTNLTSITFNVGFSKVVQNFNNASDLVITESGVIHTGVSISAGPAQTYTVTLTGVSGNGTITMAVSTTSDVTDLASNPLLSSVTSSPALVIDQTPPNVSSVSVVGPNPTYHPEFTVAFSEDVIGFADESDLTITPSGTVAYTGVNITGGPQSYTVTFVGTTGVGSLTVKVNSASDAHDPAGNALSVTTPSATVNVDTVPPNATAITPTTPSPTNATSIGFTVQFDKNVYDFNDANDLIFNEMGINHAGVMITGGPQTYSVQVTGVAGDGTMSLAVKTGAQGGDTHDLATNLVATSVTSIDVDIDNIGPAATAIAITSPNPTHGSTATFRVTFNEVVEQFDAESDLYINQTGTLAHTGISITGGPQNTVFQVFVTGMTGEGTMTMAVRTGAQGGNVRDLVTNGLVSSVTSAALVVDLTQPRAATITPTTPNPTNSSTVTFSVVFTEDVQHFNNSLDLVITESGVSHSTATVTQVNGSTYTVTLNDIYGDGTVTLAVSTASDVTDMADNALLSSVTSVPVIVDNVDPEVTVDSLVTTDQTPGLTGTMSDNVGIASVNVTVNGNTYPATLGAGTWGANVTDTLPEGTYDVVATVTDTATNTAVDSTLNELTIDLTPPTATVTPQITSITTPTVSGTVSDNVAVASVTFIVNGYEYTATVVGNSWSGQVTHALPTPPSGTQQKYDVAVTATDTAGNVGHDATTLELTIDADAPTVYVNSQTTNNNRPTLTGTATFSGAATDIVSVTVTIQGYAMDVAPLGPLNGNTRMWTATIPVGLTVPDGTYDIVAVATDDLARSGSDGTTNELTVDTVAPTVAFSLQETSPTSANAIHIRATFSEAVAPTFDASDVTLTGSLAGAATFVVSGTGPLYTITVTMDDPNSDGTIGLQIGTQVRDAALNYFAGAATPLIRIHNWFGFVTQPHSAYVYEGNPYAFSVSASMGNSVPVYAWKWDDGAVHSVGTNSPAYSLANVAGNAGDYWCEVTYDGIKHWSNTATLHVAPPLQIVQQPQTVAVQRGEPAEFTVLASGGFAPLTYEWWKDGVRLALPSADPAWSIPAVDFLDAGLYHVVVSDSQTEVKTSINAELIVGAGLPVAGATGLAALAAACLAFGARRIAARKK